MKRITWRPSSKAARLLTATAITTIAGGLVTSAVVAAVSFQGQGTVDFERVKTKTLTVTSATASVDVRGSLRNPTSGKPLKISDNFRVTGTADFLTVLKNTTAGKPVKVDDNLKVTGNLDVDGSLSAGNVTAIEENVALNRAKLIVWHDYLDCVAEFSQYTTYLESEDTIFCWNTYVAGTPILPPLGRNEQEGPMASDALVPATKFSPTLSKK